MRLQRLLYPTVKNTLQRGRTVSEKVYVPVLRTLRVCFERLEASNTGR